MAPVVLALVFAAGPAGDWPGWRGPTGDGKAVGSGYPLNWDVPAGTNVKWKTAVPGTGHASPAVFGDRVYTVSCRESTKERLLVAFDRGTGKLIREKTVVVAPLEKKHKLNSFASSTPAVDAERVYVSFFDAPRMRIFAFDHDGNTVWEKSPGEFKSQHGYCSPPVRYKNLVIVNGDQDAVAFLVALDAKTGEEVWRIDRPNRTRSYSPPVIVPLPGGTQMILTGSKCVAGYDPDTGKQLWLVNGPTEQFVSGVVHDGGTVFLTAGFPERWVMAIDPTGRGNVTKSHVKWSKKNDGGYVPSPVAHDGRFFLITDEGLASCWDSKSGKPLWKERLGNHASSSAVVAEGRVYFTDDDGTTYTVAAAADYQPLAKSTLGERCYSSPAFAGGEIFVRGETHMICIAAPAKKP